MKLVSMFALSLAPFVFLFSSDIPKDFSHAVNASSMELCEQLSCCKQAKNENFLFFTPNLLATFSMLHTGAPEGAKQELERFLRMSLLEDNYHTCFGQWLTSLKHRSCETSSDLKKETSQFFFNQGQAILTRSGVSLNQQAQTLLKSYKPQEIIFSYPVEAKNLANAWVEKQTEGKITNLVEELPADTVLMLMTAALFQGQWVEPFKEEYNTQDVFYNADGSQVSYTRMNGVFHNLKFYHDPKSAVQMCQLPFNGEVSLILIKAGDSYAKPHPLDSDKLRAFMTHDRLLPVLTHFEEQSFTNRGVSIGIPKINIKEKTDLFSDLKGEKLIQSLQKANWTGSLVNNSQPTKTDQLISEAQLQINESGAQIAAATYIAMYTTCCKPPFIINGPFGLVLWDNKTKTILGLGQILTLETE